MSASPAEATRELWEQVGEFVRDPLGYVYWAFPWGQGELVGHSGPDVWQVQALKRLGEEIAKRAFDPLHPTPVDPVLMAARSGHGVGKGALSGQISCFLLDTRPKCKGTVSANTGDQLSTKTFPEICKWRRLSITAGVWDILEGDRRIRHKSFRNSWFLQAVTWDKKRTEAFAGQHAADSSSWVLLDECSAIPSTLIEVGLGAMTDGEPFYFLWGNPTRNSGYFHQVFARMRHQWITFEVDSRTSRFTNKRLLQQWIDDYGLNSDFVRVRVLGKEPKAGQKQLIGSDLVVGAMLREASNVPDDEPLILGVDVARFGDDESVIVPRRGEDARSLAWHFHRGLDTQQLAGRVAERCDDLATRGMPVDMICVDGGGVGGGVVDRLVNLGYPVEDVNFGGRPSRPDRFKDRAAEMWVRMKAWLERGCVPDDSQLEQQVTAREYDHTDDQRLYLESKDDLKERGEPSPDRADALALTFASVVSKRNKLDRPQRQSSDWDPYA